MDLTPKQQTSEAIRQAETILILTGQHPSVDQATAVIALTAILRKFGKTATAVISDNAPAAVQTLDVASVARNLGGQRDFVLKLDVSKVEVDKLRYEVENGKLNIHITPFKGSFAPSDVTFDYGQANINYDLVIVLGVPTRARIDRLYEQNTAAFATIPLVNLDFHRSNENYGAVNLIEPNASSLCEMLVALSESLQSGIIDAEIATALLMGIVASTDRFTAAHTSPKSLTVAAQMMAAGARQQAVVRALYRDGRSQGGERQSGERGERPERSERRDDRGDRRERDERPAARSGQGQAATSESQAPAPRPQAPAPNPQPAAQPIRSEPAAAAAPATSVPAPEPSAPAEPKPAVNPVVAMAAAEPESHPDPSDAPAPKDLPIIEPGHIEMSQPEPAPESQPAPPIPTPPPASRPPLPLADFAAAAEVFNRQPGPDPAPERDQS